MKKSNVFVLLTIILFNVFIINEKNVSYAAEPEVIWLKKAYGSYYLTPEGLIEVGLNGRNGYINKEGKEIIPLKYDSGYSFKGGQDIAKLGDKYGYIDKTGKVVIPLKYDQLSYLEKGLSIVSLGGKMGLLKNPLVEENLKVEIAEEITNVVPTA